MKIFLYSLNSCGMRNVRVSAYRGFLSENGHELIDNAKEAEIILIWTCGFRSDMRDNSISEIKRCEKEFMGEVIVTGCLPDIDREYLNQHFKGKIIPWRDDNELMEKLFDAPKLRLADVPLILSKEQIYEDEQNYRKENPEVDVPYIGRYIQLYIAEGCPWECTYCSERLAFPPFRSYPEDKIVETVHGEIERSGKYKVVLLADSVGDYGIDTGTSLTKLLWRLREEIPELVIAMQDFNPYHFLKFKNDMIEFIKEGFIAHLQIPYQSANNRILKKMKRPYTNTDIKEVFQTLNDLSFKEVDSHLIVGFPGETDEEFEESVQFAVEYRIKYMLVNSFMETPSMPAADFPHKVSAQTKHNRLQYAEECFNAAGIMSNCDYGSLACERFSKLKKRLKTDF